MLTPLVSALLAMTEPAAAQEVRAFVVVGASALVAEGSEGHNELLHRMFSDPLIEAPWAEIVFGWIRGGGVRRRVVYEVSASVSDCRARQLVERALRPWCEEQGVQLEYRASRGGPQE